MNPEPWYFEGCGPLGSVRLGQQVLMSFVFLSDEQHRQQQALWSPMSRMWLPVLLPVGLGVQFPAIADEAVREYIEPTCIARFSLQGEKLWQRLTEFSTALVIQQADRYMAQWVDDQVNQNLPGGDAGSAACLASFAASKEKAKSSATRKR